MVVCKRKMKFDFIGSWANTDGRVAIAKTRLAGMNTCQELRPGSWGEWVVEVGGGVPK